MGKEVLLHVGRTPHPFMDSQRLVLPFLPALCQFRTSNDGYGIDAGYIRFQAAYGASRMGKARPVLSGKSRHELMTDGKAILAQQCRSFYYLPGRMPPSGLFQHIVIHGLYAQLDRRHAIALQTPEDGSGDAVGTGRAADGVDASCLKGFIRRFQQTFLQRCGDSGETAAIKSGFPVPFPHTLCIRMDEMPDFTGIGDSRMAGNTPLVAKDTTVWAADVGNKNGDNRCAQRFVFHRCTPYKKNVARKPHFTLYHLIFSMLHEPHAVPHLSWSCLFLRPGRCRSQ